MSRIYKTKTGYHEFYVGLTKVGSLDATGLDASVAAKKVLNTDTTPIYDETTGAWTFEDHLGNTLISATTSAITLAKATTIGAATNTPYTTFHTLYKSLFAGTPTDATDLNGTIRFGSNSYSASGNQPTRVSGLTGAQIAILNRTSDTDCFFVQVNKAADSATTAAVTAMSISSTGAVTFPVNTQHTFGNISTANTADTILSICANGATWSPYMAFRHNTFPTCYIGMENNNRLITPAAEGDLCYVTNGKAHVWSVDNGTTAAMSISSTGAVTVGASGAGAHTAQASATGVGTVLIVNNLTDATNGASIRFRDNGSTIGSVGSTTSYPLAVYSNVDTNVMLVPAGLGDGTMTLTSKVVGVSSDIRLKNLTDNQEIPGLDAICAITPARYTWKNPDMGTAVHLGFIAQDVQPHIPEAVGKPGEDGMLGFYDRPVLAAVVKAIQELNAKLDAAYAEITSLKSA